MSNINNPNPENNSMQETKTENPENTASSSLLSLQMQLQSQASNPFLLQQSLAQLQQQQLASAAANQQQQLLALALASQQSSQTYNPLQSQMNIGNLGSYNSGSMSLANQQLLALGAFGPDGRRKNATRESTQALKAWLSEHRKNPYPTKAEKVMLALVSRMTLTQVSTWFANARRRLKKENKMTWSPRNNCAESLHDSDQEENLSTSLRNPNVSLPTLPSNNLLAIANKQPANPSENRVRSFSSGTSSIELEQQARGLAASISNIKNNSSNTSGLSSDDSKLKTSPVIPPQLEEQNNDEKVDIENDDDENPVVALKQQIESQNCKNSSNYSVNNLLQGSSNYSQNNLNSLLLAAQQNPLQLQQLLQYQLLLQQQSAGKDTVGNNE